MSTQIRTVVFLVILFDWSIHTFFSDALRCFNSKCYYFVSSLDTYNNAQTACNSKCGTTGGKLAEASASEELYTFLFSIATSINSGPYCFGIDDLQYNEFFKAGDQLWVYQSNFDFKPIFRNAFFRFD